VPGTPGTGPFGKSTWTNRAYASGLERHSVRLVTTPPHFECDLAPVGAPTEVACNAFPKHPPPYECLISKTGDPSAAPPKTYRTYWPRRRVPAGTPCVS
jgi:hypothetical protein